MKHKTYTKQFTAVSLVLLLFCILVLQSSFVYANEGADEEITEEEKEKLEEQKNEYEDEKERYKKKVEKKQKEKAALQGNLGVVKQSLSTTKRTIDEVIGDIEKKEKEIDRRDAQINQLNDEVELYKSSLSDTIRRAYFASGNQSLIHVVENNGSERFLKKTDSLDDMRQKIIDVVNKVESAKQLQEKKKNELIDLKKEKEKLLSEHKEIESTLLAQSTNVQTEIIKVDASLQELQKKLAEVETDLAALTGKSYDAKDIKEAVKFASKKTGVPKGVLYGFLERETGRGANTGQCTYKDVEKVSVKGYEQYGSKYKKSIDLLYKRKDLFYDIVDDLDYKKSKKISCTLPFSRFGPNQGGAMGVAQFMSDTWLGYESRIAASTGHKHPDPWSLTDGVMAMALKLKSAGATSDSSSAIKKAVTNYYGIFDQNYYNTVMYWSKNYKKLL